MVGDSGGADLPTFREQPADEGIANAAGVSFPALPVEVITAPSLRLDTTLDRQRLSDTVQKIQPVLLILDPLIRLHRLDKTTPRKSPRCFLTSGNCNASSSWPSSWFTTLAKTPTPAARARPCVGPVNCTAGATPIFTCCKKLVRTSSGTIGYNEPCLALETCANAGFGQNGEVSEVTCILDRVQQGEAKAAEELLPLVYEELRKLASARMAWIPPGQTLQPTALVHEAWLRLAGSGQEHWNSRGHFFAAAAEAMRRILVDQARRKSADKRGGNLQRVNFDHVDIAAEANSDLLILLDEALAALAEHDPTAAELIKLRFFAGLPNIQAAAALGVPERTAKRAWAYARAWLYREIQKRF